MIQIRKREKRKVFIERGCGLQYAHVGLVLISVKKPMLMERHQLPMI